MLTLHSFFSHKIPHILGAFGGRASVTIFLSVASRREIFSAHLAPLCVLRAEFCIEIFVKRKHRAEKVIAVDVVLTDELHAHIVEQNTVAVHTVATLTPYELVNLSSLLII